MQGFFLLFIQVLQLMFEFVDKGVVENISIKIVKKNFFDLKKRYLYSKLYIQLNLTKNNL